MEGVILAIGEAALRPGEIFGLHSDIDDTTGIIRVTSHAKLSRAPASRRTWKPMPKINEEIVFPTPRGMYMRRSTWSAHWHAIRTAARMPGPAFYELRHRAIQRMIDPTDDGWLGLDSQTVAQLVGHSDRGYLIASTYTKLTQHRAHARAQRALDLYSLHS